MATRQHTPELMDDPAIEGDQHVRALEGLARINRLSLAATPIVRAIRTHIGPGNLSILDVATGSGDVAHSIVQALGPDYKTHVVLTDISQRALTIAINRFEKDRAEMVCMDALRDPLPSADVVLCTLFLHHLSEERCVSLLARMSAAAKKLLVVSDLRRSDAGTVLAKAVPRLLTTSHVVRVDAVKSAKAAFTIDELQGHAHAAGLMGATIQNIIPCRMLLTWQPQL